MTDVPDFLGLVLDRVRLAVLGHAAVDRVDSAGLAAALDVDEKRVLKAVASLEAAGLMIDGRLVEEALWELAASRPQIETASATVVEGPWDAEELRILQTFFTGDRLSRIPEKRGKRLVVLERLAMEFEPGVRYDEREVNFRLQLFHQDYAALRRYMVDEGLMTRADGVYWRTGGRT
ncbi:MAG TPA: DUF2087 domain-containing protein [Acidimicrobiia bacterium]|nr:DUF2087 domain-containing protein [Acidimicrobiia bacterium]